VAEAMTLSERHPEIVLTGIHIGSWGVDRGQTLSELVEALVRRVPRVRFRLSSLEATEVDTRLGSLLRSGELAPHLHAPLQSGSDRLLRRMGRHWYTARSYEEALNALVRGRDIFGLGADVICGFPGETDEDHEATVALVERLPYTYLHVFPFSSRPGTPAARLGPAVAPPVIERRSAELRDVAAKQARAYRQRRAGGEADVVVTRGGPQCEGMTEDFLTVGVRPPLPRGTRLRARLTMENERLLCHPERSEGSSCVDPSLRSG
jgi:threonylcarbamoyladenosine tRNA methylthiotransferase MtaB